MNYRMYRGKRIDNGGWVEGFYAAFGGKDNKYHVIFTGKFFALPAGEGFAPEMYYVDPETVGQFVGIEDKNKKPIFDGDIVKTKHGRVCRICLTICGGHVGFDMDALEAKNSAPTPYDLWCSYNLEVIGNIHANPELLEVQP